MSPCGNIILVGLSGAGKTSCAQILAGLLDLAVLDTDDLIQKNAGMSVTRIFSEKGEAYFRALERQLIEDLLAAKLQGTVLSVGGGLPAEADNVQLLKSLGYTVFLNANPRTLAQRLSQDLERDHSLRPLLARPQKHNADHHRDHDRDHDMVHHTDLDKDVDKNLDKDLDKNLDRDLDWDLDKDHRQEHRQDCKEERNGVKEDNLALALGDQLARRRKYYEEAHLVIDTNGKSKQDICLEIQTIIVNNGF